MFGHFTTQLQGMGLRAKLIKAGFRGFVFERDSCDDVELKVEGIDSTQQQKSFEREATAAGFQVSFEVPDAQKAPRAGNSTAVFGHRATLSQANKLQQAIAHVGFRDNDIVRNSVRDWAVVIYQVPDSAQAAFAQEARAAGFNVTFQ